MRTLRILFAKELNATLTSPIGYTVAAVFLLVLGYTFSLTLFATQVANHKYIFNQMYVLSPPSRGIARSGGSCWYRC